TREPFASREASVSVATVPVAHKFGGSSLADAQRIAHVADVLTARDDASQVIVVSAMQGVTDALIALVHAASTDPDTAQAQLQTLIERHRKTAHALLGDQDAGVLGALERDWNDLTALLRAA